MSQIEQEPLAELEPVEGETQEPEGEAPEGGTEPEGRARDPETGQFVATEPEPELILGRFKSHEDLEKAYKELDSEFGRRNQEWGELRKELTQIREGIEKPSQQQVPLTQQTVDWFDERIDENPYAAAEWARSNDPSGVLYGRALDSWYDTQPRHASAYERQLERHDWEERQRQSQEPVQEILAQQRVTDAFLAVRTENPEIDQYAEQILAKAQEMPELLVPLQSGSVEDGRRVIRNLLLLAKAEQANTVVSETGQILADQQAASEAAKRQGFVATGSQVREAETKTVDEQWLEEVFDPAAARYYGDT